MSFERGKPIKVLGLLAGQTAEAVVEGEQRGLGAVEEVFDLPESVAQVQVIKYPKIEDVPEQLQNWRPNVIYVNGGALGERAGLQRQALSALGMAHGEAGEASFVAILSSLGPSLVYLDASGAMAAAEKLHAAGVPHVIAWPATSPPLALPSMHFAHAFFACLRNATISIPEAFAIASELTLAYASQVSGDAVTPPPLPLLLSAKPPALPDSASVPPFSGKATAGLGNRPLHEIVPGYAAIRMCAPHAELRLLLAALYDIINAPCMGHLCQALRGLLVAEVRSLRLVNAAPCPAPPQLPAGSAARRCTAVTASGAIVTIVLGGPQDVLQDSAIVEFGLRQTLAADAQALQLKLPPPGAPLPAARSDKGVAGGSPCVEALAVTSVWVVQVLKSLSASPSGRAMVAAGIAAVSSTATAAFSKADGNRFTTVATKNDPASLFRAGKPTATAAMVTGAVRETVPPAPAMAVAAAGALPPAAPAFLAAPQPNAAARLLPQQQQTPAADGAAPLRPPSGTPEAAFNNVAFPAASAFAPSPVPPQSDGSMDIGAGALAWSTDRGPLASVSQENFLTDLAKFHTERLGRQGADFFTFPGVNLNGRPLDVLALYREVCKRGGYRAANRIDWKGSIFPAMANFTADATMTAVGNALKHHYQSLLLDYERANPADVQNDGCAACGAGDAGPDDGACAACRMRRSAESAEPGVLLPPAVSGPEPMLF